MGKRRKIEQQTRRRQKIRLSPENSDEEYDTTEDLQEDSPNVREPDALNDSDAKLKEFLQEIDQISAEDTATSTTVNLPAPSKDAQIVPDESPAVWQEVFDDYYKCAYYWNPSTNESSWEPPQNATINRISGATSTLGAVNQGGDIDPQITGISATTTASDTLHPHPGHPKSTEDAISNPVSSAESIDGSDNSAEDELMKLVKVSDAKFSSLLSSELQISPILVQLISFRTRYEDWVASRINSDYFLRCMRELASFFTAWETEIARVSECLLSWNEVKNCYEIDGSECLASMLPERITVPVDRLTDSLNIFAPIHAPLPVHTPPLPPPPPEIEPPSPRAVSTDPDPVESTRTHSGATKEDLKKMILEKAKLPEDFDPNDPKTQYKLYKEMRKLAKQQKKEASARSLVADYDDDSESEASDENESQSSVTSAVEQTNSPRVEPPAVTSPPRGLSPVIISAGESTVSSFSNDDVTARSEGNEENVVYCLPSGLPPEADPSVSTNLPQPQLVSSVKLPSLIAPKKKKDKSKSTQKFKNKNMNHLVDKWAKVKQQIAEDPNTIEGSYDFEPQPLDKWKDEQQKISTDNPNFIQIGDSRNRLKSLQS